ncbi:MAG TPA: hypothetical protein VF559_08180 [Caulobacteraceae bacterium]|jgi:hypothetical protein
MKFAGLAVHAASAAALCACSQGVKAPTERGVCWHAIPQKGGQMKFNVLSRDADRIEKCAAELEGMRMRFLGMGGARELMGAYQGSYLFVMDEGILRGETLTGARYVMLVRTGDGRLAIPGAMPQE